MNYSYLRHGLCLGLVALLLLPTCKGAQRAPTLTGDVDLGTGGTRGPGSAGAAGSGGATGGGPDGGADMVANNCGELVCRGAGKCVVTNEVAACVCDDGYVLTEGECIVDETCIRLRTLENGCRQRIDTEPALGVFFGIETCAGTSVLPEVLGDVNQAFKTIENGSDLDDESYAAVLKRDVESFVAISLDLSGTRASDQALLVPLITDLKRMVQALEPDPGGPLVSVALLVFGRTVHLTLDFTSDFGAVAAKLDEIQADPAGAIDDPGGTNLNGAVNRAVDEIERALDARYAATLGAVVAMGTLVTITDGRDNAGVRLDAIGKYLNLISIGISSNIDDQELTRVGPQGSFLAPEQTDWAQAFDRVAARVNEYPSRAYLLGYCSPAVDGNHQVAVTLAARETRSDATCSFSADDFGVGLGVCNADFINNYCASRTCGSFLACGVCPGDPTMQATDDRWTFSN